MNSTYDIDYNLHFYADIPMIREDYKEAAIRYLNAARTSSEHGDMILAIIDLQGIGMSLCGMGRHVEGLKIIGASIAKLEAIGATGPTIEFWSTLLDRTMGKSMSALGEERSNEAMAEGRKIKFEETIAYAAKLVK